MRTVNLSKSDTELSRLVDETLAGEEVVITREGRPVAKLVPVEQQPAEKPKRQFGLWAGQVRIGDDFDDPLPEDIMKAFRGESE